MEHATVPELELDWDEYPPVVDPLSGPLPSNKYTPKSKPKTEKTLPTPQLTVRENNSGVDLASQSFYSNRRIKRTRSLPDITLPVPEWMSEQCPPTPVHSSTVSPSKRNSTPSQKPESIPVVSGVAVQDSVPSVDPAFTSLRTKKHRRSSSISQADTTQLEPNFTTKGYLPWNNPMHAALPAKQPLSSAGSKTDNTPPNPEVNPEGHLQRCKDAKTSRSPKEQRQSSTRNMDLPLPPQNWTLDTYHPVISPASIPLPTSKPRHSPTTTVANIITATPTVPVPTLTLTTPSSEITTPSWTTTMVRNPGPEEPQVLDSSRLHPNAAWSQLANWTHKMNLRLVGEIEMLQMENGVMRTMLVKFTRVLGEMGMPEQIEFQKKLDELPGVPRGSEEVGPRGSW